MAMVDDVLFRLEQVLRDRDERRPPSSYVSQLLTDGHPAIASKIIEEAYELVAAAADAESSHDIVHEAADLLFHMMVLLQSHRLSLEDVRQELNRRFGVSGRSE